MFSAPPPLWVTSQTPPPPPPHFQSGSAGPVWRSLKSSVHGTCIHSPSPRLTAAWRHRHSAVVLRIGTQKIENCLSKRHKLLFIKCPTTSPWRYTESAYLSTVLLGSGTVHCMNRSAQDHRFSLFLVICSQLPVTRTPDNSNLFLFPLKVRIIGSILYNILYYKHIGPVVKTKKKIPWNKQCAANNR